MDSDGNVYVADTLHNQIQKFTSNGTFITNWNGATSAGGKFRNPYCVAVDSDGNVYVADSSNNQIQKFTSNGGFITNWNGSALAGGALSNPDGVAVDSSGYVYVADKFNNRIQKFFPVTTPTAVFTANVTNSTVPLAVQFTDLSTGSPTNWSWSLGDGDVSTVQSPSHTYATAGKYTVNLTATNASGNNTTVKTNYITVTASTPPAPVAGFTANVTNGGAPLGVEFIDPSTGTPTSWSWYFGDGTAPTTRSPSHTYAMVGTFTVNLTVTNDSGSNTTVKTNYISVHAVVPPTTIPTTLPTTAPTPSIAAGFYAVVMSVSPRIRSGSRISRPVRRPPGNGTSVTAPPRPNRVQPTSTTGPAHTTWR